MSIEVKELLKTYGTQKAVNNISFSVRKGEIVGFLGPNGAGKSTTMKIIAGYLQQDAGVATVTGIDVSTEPLKAKRKTGYLPEANPLYYDMYVKEYLNFVAGVYGLSDVAKNVQRVIDMVGLQVEQNKKIGQLSKGYKQRTGLAAALIHDPEVLILDEPTSGLDPNQIIEIRNVIKQQGKDKTVLFSSHILQEVEAVCDRIIIINKGEIVADDTLHSLQTRRQGNMVAVTFKEIVDSKWLEDLVAVNSVTRINENSWRLFTSNPEDARKQLLQLSIDRNLNIVSLQTEGNNLEDIFRSLTSS
ncbi:gliding motility-associated ABC transporter ATP-binding subunit GldA [Danxiaibacter flavus]|uniref:Gliding motility-associated ABC transporter ATP-binding subunit GldA n=1 Tax=Danxiaibacter flavus TaxID=3049108 RepID=A0ABV3ZIW1_9BACT|nr:gliding motility-associated ABC transporter ATP-binding subunit GldA [Chitinophagaceae bacterium DXS]